MSASFGYSYEVQCLICRDKESVKCSACQAPSENNLAKAVTAAFSKLNSLANKVSNLESVLKMHNERFGNLEVNNDSDSGGGLGRECSSNHCNQGDPKVMLSKENVKKVNRKENSRKSKAFKKQKI